MIPTPRKGESEKDFVNRCIPYVIHEGTADDNKQAAAICHSIWRRSKGIKDEPPEQSKKTERVHLNLCANVFSPSNFVAETKNTDNLDRATLIVGDGTYNGIYFPTEELEKAFTSWEHQPINLDHSDKVEDEIGYIVDVQWDDVRKRVTAQPVLNPFMPKYDVAKGFIRSRFEAGKYPEGSIGVWLDKVYEDMGEGEEDRLTARNLEGDHYAIVTRGACSPEDGCGIGLSDITIPINLDEVNATVSIDGKKSTFTIYQDDDEPVDPNAKDDEEELKKKRLELLIKIEKEKIKKQKGGY